MVSIQEEFDELTEFLNDLADSLTKGQALFEERPKVSTMKLPQPPIEDYSELTAESEEAIRDLQDFQNRVDTVRTRVHRSGTIALSAELNSFNLEDPVQKRPPHRVAFQTEKGKSESKPIQFSGTGTTNERRIALSSLRESFKSIQENRYAPIQKRKEILNPAIEQLVVIAQELPIQLADFLCRIFSDLFFPYPDSNISQILVEKCKMIETGTFAILRSGGDMFLKSMRVIASGTTQVVTVVQELLKKMTDTNKKQSLIKATQTLKIHASAIATAAKSFHSKAPGAQQRLITATVDLFCSTQDFLATIMVNPAVLIQTRGIGLNLIQFVQFTLQKKDKSQLQNALAAFDQSLEIFVTSNKN